MSHSQLRGTASAAMVLTGLVCLTLYADGLIALAGGAGRSFNAQALDFILETVLAHPGILTPLLAQFAIILGLHGLFFLAVIMLGRIRHSPSNWRETSAAGYVFAWLSLSWILIRINDLLFSHSIWRWAFLPLTEAPLSPLLDIAASLFVFWRLSLVALHAAAAIRRYWPGRPSIAATALFLLSGTALMAAEFRTDATAASKRHKPPNIVVIGLDSLQREIALGHREPRMPALEAFRSTAFVHANVVSPLPRTFPAWVTILTGEHPQQHGARFNLAQQSTVERDQGLAHTLRRQGYRTVYATDETRFSNIGKEFGFDSIISPSAGAPDFLLGTIGDHPLVNLATQIPYAELLLPALVGNRAFASAYQPKQFISRLEHGLGPGTAQPTFLAVHLCLAHWPYFSAAETRASADHASPYLDAVRDLDDQFALLLKRLTVLGYIDGNTLLVVLADHGEGIDTASALPREFVSHVEGFIPGRLPGGHGTTLLDPSQWQVFTMFSGAGIQGPIAAGSSSQLASLEDLAPTILRLAGLSSDSPYVLDVASQNSGDHRMPAVARPFVTLETGFRPPRFDPTNPDQATALGIAETTYNVMDDGRLEMKPSVFQAGLLDKDIGITDGERSLITLRSGDRMLLLAQIIEKKRWEVFPVQPNRKLASPPLMTEACTVPAIRDRIPAWCQRSDSKRSQLHAARFSRTGR